MKSTLDRNTVSIVTLSGGTEVLTSGKASGGKSRAIKSQ